MNDIKHFLNIVEGVPSTFTATHFHKNNLGGNISLMYNPEDQKFYWRDQGEIKLWSGNVNSRSRMNPASVDGEIVDGKFVDYPEGVTFADKQREGESGTASSSSGNDTSQPAASTSGTSSSSSTPTPGVQGDRLTLSDGSSFRKEPASQEQLNRKASQLVDRMVALLRKMNESVPVSMRGYIVESGIAELLLEALTPAETQELKTIYADLRAIERSNFLLRPQNQENLKRFLDREGSRIEALVVAAGGNAEPAAEPTAEPAASTTSDPAADAQADDAARSSEPTTSSDTDFSSDESIEKAIKDPENWISNEMPKELAKYDARGLSKAARGRKSASVAAVQQVMKRIGAVTNDSVFNIETDGKMGPKTREAVKAAQELAGITVDGDPGADTAKQLVDFAKNPTAAGGIGEKRIIRDVERAIELLKKQNEDSGTTQQNSSIDFRNLIRIVESKLLNEALSDDEKKELDDILARLKAKLDDGEYIDGLKDSNPDLHTKFKELQQLQSGRTPPTAQRNEPASDPAADAQADDAARPPTPGVASPASAANVAADPDRDGNADDPEAQVFMQDTPTAARQLRTAMRGLGTDEDAIFRVMQQVKSQADWDRLQREYKELTGDELVADLESELDDTDMVRYVWDPLASNGVRPRGQTDEPAGSTSRGRNEPRTRTTSDPAADAQADDAARTTPPESSSSSTEQLRAELARLDMSKAEDAKRWIQIHIQNDELMNELSPDLQRQIRDAAEAQGIR